MEDNSIILNWEKYPQNKPKNCGKCLVELQEQKSLGLCNWLWLVNWNYIDNKWKDFAGENDIKHGAIVKSFIEDKYLWQKGELK